MVICVRRRRWFFFGVVVVTLNVCRWRGVGGRIDVDRGGWRADGVPLHSPRAPKLELRCIFCMKWHLSDPCAKFKTTQSEIGNGMAINMGEVRERERESIRSDEKECSAAGRPVPHLVGIVFHKCK